MPGAFFIFECHMLHNALIICYFCLKLNYLGIMFNQDIVALLFILNFTWCNALYFFSR